MSNQERDKDQRAHAYHHCRLPKRHRMVWPKDRVERACQIMYGDNPTASLMDLLPFCPCGHGEPHHQSDRTN